MRRLKTSIAIIAFVSGATACGGDQRAKDDDFERHLAKPIPLNKVFTDSLTHLGEDHADWKVVHTDRPGLLMVTVRFDEVQTECEVYLADKYGAKMAREVHAGQPHIELVRRVEPGRFFVWINAPSNKCASSYSLEARLDPD